MSYLNFNPDENKSGQTKKTSGSIRKAFSKWLIENYGDDYKEEVERQRTKGVGITLEAEVQLDVSAEFPKVGIVDKICTFAAGK